MGYISHELDQRSCNSGDFNLVIRVAVYKLGVIVIVQEDKAHWAVVNDGAVMHLVVLIYMNRRRSWKDGRSLDDGRRLCIPIANIFILCSVGRGGSAKQTIRKGARYFGDASSIDGTFLSVIVAICSNVVQELFNLLLRGKLLENLNSRR